jgi:predicted short-subunit dehydrogenase-like oxidoreductase (DUF2520 family)
MSQYNISFAGAGRVGNALCRELYQSGYTIELVATETERSGRPVADFCKASWSPYLVFPATTRIIIVAVPDHRLKNVLNEIKCHPDTLILHTSGSTGLDVFPEKYRRTGVFYPLQTFSKGRKVSFTDLPVLIESSDEVSLIIIKEIAGSIGAKVHCTDTEHRRMLHIAAVFVNNFTNHILTAGKIVAARSDLSFDILIPLIEETVSKALAIGPENSQTGPAIRNDKNTIEKHLELLSFSPDLQNLYNEITRSIIKYYSKS